MVLKASEATANQYLFPQLPSSNPAEMTDLKDEEDVKVFVDAFYAKVRADPVLGPVFSGVIPDDNWDPHLNKMYGFWTTVLFAKPEYRGNPFSKHVNLPVENIHFQRWIDLCEETIGENFSGEKADEVLVRSNKMRITFQSKLERIRISPNYTNIM